MRKQKSSQVRGSPHPHKLWSSFTAPCRRKQSFPYLSDSSDTATKLVIRPPSPRPSPPREGESFAASLKIYTTGLAGRSSAKPETAESDFLSRGRGLKVRADVNTHSSENVEEPSHWHTKVPAKISWSFRLLAKRQRAGALQDASRISGIIVSRTASWTAAALRRFSPRHIQPATVNWMSLVVPSFAVASSLRLEKIGPQAQRYNYNFTHRPFWADSSTAASTRWFFRPSSNVGDTGLFSTHAFTKSATVWTKVCS